MRGESQLQRRALRVQILPAREVLTCCEGSVKTGLRELPLSSVTGKIMEKARWSPAFGREPQSRGQNKELGFLPPALPFFYFFL